MDRSSYKFILGAELKSKNRIKKFFSGFIKELSLYSYAALDLASLSGPVASAPSSLCAVNTFVDALGACQPCFVGCSSCVRAGTCDLCFDVNCLNCDGHFDEWCATCIAPTVTNVQGVCECGPGFVFDAVS
jgi:hypothetical protein